MVTKFKKIGVINFSGNVGKSVIANHLLMPRMPGAKLVEVETSNAGAFDDSDNQRFKGRQFEDLIRVMAEHESVIVDIGASNIEDLVKFMNKMAGSHEDFDLFILPVTPDKKQQLDTLKTVDTLADIGITEDKIRVVFNKVDTDDVDDVPSIFGAVFGRQFDYKKFTIRPDAIVFDNPVYDRLRALQKNVSEMVADLTDYTALRREAKDDQAKTEANKMLTAQRLAKSAKANLDKVFEALCQ
ncbi:MAG: StbB family protein [Janthinobacterium lividum]